MLIFENNVTPVNRRENNTGGEKGEGTTLLKVSEDVPFWLHGAEQGTQFTRPLS